MPTTVEPLRPADRAAWLDLWNGYLAFYETDLDAATTDATFARLVDPAVAMYGALARDAGGEPVGLVHWLTHAATWSVTDYCYLEDLFVVPGARAGGIGEALIAHVTTWARDHGSAKVYWLTAATNSVARRLYDRVAERSGFLHYQVDL